MDPQQELFTALLTEMRRLGYAVFDGELPPRKTPYPFIYLSDSHLIDDANKGAVFGTVLQTIHVWHDSPKKRGSVSKMCLEIKTACRKLEKTRGFSWYCKNVSQRILTDATTKTPLLHAVIDAEFKFS